MAFPNPAKPCPVCWPSLSPAGALLQERAHRIGQTKKVTIYRIICKDTVEDLVLKRALMKIKLTNAVLGNPTTVNDEDATNLVDIIKVCAF